MWKKLQLKESAVIILNRPASFQPVVNELDSNCAVFDAFNKKSQTCKFALCFVTSKAQVDSVAADIGKMCGNDPVVWFAYLKGSSKLINKKTSDISRDKGFESLAAVNFEPVSGVSIDDDWSALRFRKVGNIKEMTRKFAKTDEGKAKVEKAKKEGRSCTPSQKGNSKRKANDSPTAVDTSDNMKGEFNKGKRAKKE